jgi:hypothetical protein
MSTSCRFVFVMTLLLSLTFEAAAEANARPSGSFRGGFSSHTTHAPAAAPRPGGGFGSFGNRAAAPAPQKSDSALSRQLGKQQAEANALRTLDERRAAAARPAQPVPVQPQSPQQQPAPAPAAPTTVIVRQDSGGIGHVVAGAMLAHAMAGAHANTNAGYGYPAPMPAPAPAVHRGGSVLGAIAGGFLWLCVLLVLGCVLVLAWKRLCRRREANQPNYTFERN